MGADLAVSTGRDDRARGAIGLREVLFQSVTHMAPAGAVAVATAGLGYLGLLYLAYLVRRQPDRLRQTERVFVEEAIP